jgi:two-component system C4-dicarboxylate transport sensor histidine kinase DctB
MCVVPLRTSTKTAAAILLDGDARAITTLPEALISTWEASLRVSSQQEGSRRLAEQFNQVNRTLVQTQARLAETEAMAKLGTVTAGAAHEMNNPLTVISGRSQLLLTSLSNARDKAAAESIVEASRDLTDLITSLNLIATVPRAEPATCSLVSIMDQSWALVRERLGKLPLVTLKVGPGTEKVYTDISLLSKSIAEAVLNAAQSAPTTPIEVTCETVGTSLSIAIQDSGPGFSAQALRHAFDPFFSQKPAGRSRGLGLARARSMVTGLGGEITLANTEGKGGLVVIHLPSWREPKPQAQDRRSITASTGRVP